MQSSLGSLEIQNVSGGGLQPGPKAACRSCLRQKNTLVSQVWELTETLVKQYVSATLVPSLSRPLRDTNINS